jgi:predicted dehydrogenase
VADRCVLAEKAGALLCAAPDESGTSAVERALIDATSGIGADHVILAAGGSSNDPVEIAARLARDRARIVDIGKTRLDLPWNAYYDKELDLRFSRSYGPGRYDDRYELDGIDYPPGYVRWTERRNLECFVDLVAREQIDVSPLVSGTFPIADASTTYEKLRGGEVSGTGFLFHYPESGSLDRVAAGSAPLPSPRAATRPARTPGNAVRIGFVGAGSYASSMLLPHLYKDENVALGHVATSTSLSAANAQRRFEFEAVSTGADAVLDDDSLDAIFVVTRHSSHADLVCRALGKGKAVFVEKPLALTVDEADRIRNVVEETGNDRLMVGFNRRFAPLLNDLRGRFGAAEPVGPIVGTAHYQVNAGRLDASSWYLNDAAEGSRFVGEGGHFIDTLAWWFGSIPVQVHASAGPQPDEVLTTLQFANGSVATISYVTDGHSRVPKESIDFSGSGRNARLDNFRKATLWGSRRPEVSRARGGQDKGQRDELAAFVAAVRRGELMPIGFESLMATTLATIAADRSLTSGRTEPV